MVGRQTILRRTSQDSEFKKEWKKSNALSTFFPKILKIILSNCYARCVFSCIGRVRRRVISYLFAMFFGRIDWLQNRKLLETRDSFYPAANQCG